MSIQQDWQDPEPRKNGMSGGMKLLLILGGAGAFFLLLCCGGGAFIAWRAKDTLQNLMTTDPDAIRERTRAIATIDIPPGFKPTAAMDIGLMKWVQYQEESSEDSMLMLMEFSQAMMQGQNQDQMLEQMRQQQGANGHTDIDEEESHTREFTIGGKKSEFTFAKGKSEDDGTAIRQVTGSFPTATGVAMLLLIVPEEKYDEAAIVRMIESIRAPGAAAPASVEIDDGTKTTGDADKSEMEAESAPEATTDEAEEQPAGETSP